MKLTELSELIPLYDHVSQLDEIGWKDRPKQLRKLFSNLDTPDFEAITSHFEECGLCRYMYRAVTDENRSKKEFYDFYKGYEVHQKLGGVALSQAFEVCWDARIEGIEREIEQLSELVKHGKMKEPVAYEDRLELFYQHLEEFKKK